MSNLINCRKCTVTYYCAELNMTKNSFCSQDFCLFAVMLHFPQMPFLFHAVLNLL